MARNGRKKGRLTVLFIFTQTIRKYRKVKYLLLLTKIDVISSFTSQVLETLEFSGEPHTPDFGILACHTSKEKKITFKSNLELFIHTHFKKKKENLENITNFWLV